MNKSIMQWHLEPLDTHSNVQQAAWRQLAERIDASAVQMPELIFTCAETLGPKKLWFAKYGSHENPIAMAIVDLDSRLRPEDFVESQMPLGAWIQKPEILLTEACPRLMSHAPFALQFSIRQLDPRFVARPDSTLILDTLDYIETAWVELVTDFTDYWAARGKNLRSNMRRQRERLNKQSITTHMEIVTAPDAVDEAVTAYAQLESRGWKAQQGTAVSETHPQFIFYRQMLRKFAERGMARIYKYYFGEKLVACELCVCRNKEMVILKTTHDESVSPFSPASLLRQEMFEELCDQRNIQRVEFYGPLKDWHSRWTTLKRGIYQVNTYRNPLAAAAVRTRRWARTDGIQKSAGKSSAQ